MSILDNELVNRYFGVNAGTPEKARRYMAEKVIEAMEQPVKCGDKYLDLESFEVVVARSRFMSESVNFPEWHPRVLRLPDRFQEQPKKECELFTTKCNSCGFESVVHMAKPGETAKFNVWEKGDPVNERKECLYGPPFINSHSQCRHP
jgi:hypothetical protein